MPAARPSRSPRHLPSAAARFARSGRARAAVAAVAVLTAGTALFGAGQATAEHSVPRSDREIPNLDRVKDKIAAYYGDTETADGQHHASPKSPYAKQVRGVAARARRDLERTLPRGAGGGNGQGRPGGSGDSGKPGKPAIVLDIDDTTLLTYNFERRIGYAFDDKAQDDYLRSTDMRSVFGMRKLVDWAHTRGAAVFFVTGRKEYQRDWSVRNLKHAGYRVPVDKRHVYLKDDKNPPPYLPCGDDCSTIEYKSGTRKHIESLGYDIVGNFGDQYSDLRGGYADRTYKLPNPMYYLP